jgi:hydrogenase-4 component B
MPTRPPPPHRGPSKALAIMMVLLAVIALSGFAGALGGVLAPTRTRVAVVAAFTVAASLAALIVAIEVLRTGHVATLATTKVLAFTGVQLRLDPLGALFVAITAVVAIAVSVFSVGYSHHHPMSRSAACAFATFVTAMLLVPAAWSVTTFLFAWELMAVASLALVLTDYRRSANVRSAALWYAVLTQIGAATIALGLVLLAVKTGGQGFTIMASHSAAMAPWLRGTVFVLVLTGFASKAGVVPLHVWLPKAHAEAPSAVSALMSAAMVNLGIYGILRVGDTLLGGGPSWWWITVIVLGVGSAIYGSIHAATSTDLKRLLAYSTADNIGLVMIAIGTAGLLSSTGHQSFAALALFAGMFHLVNHAVFKGTLFLSAGSVQYATGTRDLDQLGGLFRRMPIASTIFAIGTVAIAALPPLCGFVSEWLLLQSLLHGLSSSVTVSVVLMPLCVAALALTGGLTAAAFVKAFGVGFLGIARSSVAEEAAEPPRLMNVGSGMLAGLCVVFGVAPIAMVGLLNHVVRTIQTSGGSIVSAHGEALAISEAKGVFDPTLIALALVASMLCVAGLRRVLSRRHAIRRAPVWGCGRELQTARMTYTATSFAEPLQRVFDDVLQPSQDLDVSHRGESRYFVESVRFGTRDGDAFERLLYQPVFATVRRIANKARLLQNGSVHRYLAYGLGALVVILVVAR